MKVEYKNHNQLFEDLQKIYLEKKQSEILGQMYVIAREYCINALINYTHKKKLVWTDERIKELGHDCATWLIEPYLKKDSFKIEKLSSYAHFALLKILFKDKDYETSIQSLNELTENNGDKYDKKVM